MLRSKRIKVIYDGVEEIYDTKVEVAKKYNFTPQYIYNILKGLTKHKFFIYNEKLVKLEYIDFIDINDENAIENFKREQKKIYNKRAYEKRRAQELV